MTDVDGLEYHEVAQLRFGRRQVITEAYFAGWFGAAIDARMERLLLDLGPLDGVLEDVRSVLVTPPVQDCDVGRSWNPWRALGRRSHLVFERARLPDRTGGAVYVPLGGREAAIVLDDRLLAPERAAALTHELIHDEQGGGCHHTDPVVRRRHERRVELEVARRLVDVDELAEFVSGRTELGEHVDARAVADWFDVTDAVAQVALELLAGDS